MNNTKSFVKAVCAVAGIAGFFSLSSCQKEMDCQPTATVDDNVVARGGIVTRPFSDFMSTQGYDFFAWSTIVDEPGGQRGADIDYMGTLAEALAFNGGPTINTQITGTLTEMPMPDGRAKVTVTMHTENAMSCGYQFATYPVIDFGYSLGDLSADPTLTPTVGWAHFKLVFYNSAMGAPIPDVAYGVPFEDYVEFNFHSSATGPMHASSGYPEGTIATMKVDQVGSYRNKNHYIPYGTTADGFPVGNITYTIQ